MKNKKRLFGALVIIILALTMIATLAACGEEETVQYTVTLKSGFDDQVTTQTLNEGEVFTLPASPFTRDGYTFDYWTEEGTTYPNQVGTPIPVYRNMTFVAHWTGNYVPDVPEDFTVTVKDGYGSGQITAVVTEGEEYVLPAADTFTRPEYTFGGWQVGDSVMEAGDSVTITANTEIIAVWNEIPKYNVSVLKGYGDNAPIATYVVPSGGSYTLPEMTLDYADHNFLGYADLSGDLTEYLAAGTVIENITSNKTFVAMWEEITYYTVYLKKTADATGTDVDNSNRVTEGGSFVLPECNFVNAGYEFTGWIYEGQPMDPGDVIPNITGDIEVIAGWKLAEEPQPEQYSVTFANGKYSMAGGSYTEEEAYIIPEGSDTYYDAEEGYKFVGWTVKGDDSGKIYKPGDRYSGNSDVIFVAQWDEIIYYSIYLSAGFEGGATALVSDKVEEGTSYRYTLPQADQFIREGYTFTGWKIGEDTYSAGETVSLTVDKNITITAVWEAIPTYTVTYYYELDGDQIAVSSAMYSGTEYDLIDYPADQTPPTGMKFDGWKLVGGDETVYPAGTRITVSGNAGYYAVYRDAVFTVAFYSDNAETASYEIAEGGNAAIPAAPEKTGYTFLGWYLNGEGEALTGKYVYNVTTDMRFEAKWQINSYEITFVYHNGSQTFNVNYGEMPAGPIDSDSYQDDDYIYTFSGTYDPEIVAVTGDCTYTAVYSKTARLYPITFNGDGYVNFLNTDGEVVSSAERKNQTAYTFRVAANPGVITEEMKVLVNGEEITAVDGLYTAPFAKETTVSVVGAEFVEYFVNAVAENVEYIADMPEQVIYGSTATILAKGVKWYEDNAPVVTYAGEEIESYGTEEREGITYHAYEVTITRNGVINISGVEDVIPVTFVDINGDEIQIEWKPVLGLIETTINLPYSTVNRTDGFTYGTLNNFVLNPPTVFDTVVAFTPDVQDSYVYEEGIDYWSQDDSINTISDFWNKYSTATSVEEFYPTKGEVNKFYILYQQPTQTTYSVGFTAPEQATGLAYYYAGDTAWNNEFVKSDTYNVLAQADAIRKFNANTDVYVRFTLDNGEYPILKDYTTGIEVAPDNYEILGESVYCYKITVNIDSNRYLSGELPEQFTFTVDLQSAKVHSWSTQPPSAVNAGASAVFAFTANYSLTNITDIDDFIDNSGTVPVIKEGMKPFEITAADGTEIPFECSISAFGTFGYNFTVTVPNITSDTLVKFNFSAVGIEIPYTVAEGYTLYVDGEPVLGDVGEVITVNVLSSGTYELIANEGYIFEVTSDDDPQFTIVRDDSGSNNLSDRLILSDSKTATLVTSLLSGQFSATDFYITGLEAVRYIAYATHDEINCDTVGDSEIAFTEEPKNYIGEDGRFAFTMTLPYGNTPVLYVEYASRPSDGSIKYYPVNADPDNTTTSTFEFNVQDIDSDISWFIKIEPNEYQITVHYGDETEVVTMKHGDRLSDSDVLRTSYVGMNNGVSGIFTVTGWQNGQGKTVISIQNGEDLYAVTEFTEAKVVFGNQVYQSLSEALAALPDDAVGNLDIVWSDEPQVLTAGEYVIPAGVTLRLPYANGQYGRKLGELTDNPSMFYANAVDGKIMLIINEGATLTVNGGISVGGIIGYPDSARPYQGQTSADHAILQLDGELIIQGGGKLEVNGYIVGNGKVELTAGAVSCLPFIVKDYRGGTNSTNVYYEDISPFNIFEMPNIQTEYIIHYGAAEKAYAMLFASEKYNEAIVEAIGENGIIRIAEGGYVVKRTTAIDNPRYSAETAAYEPVKEFRTTIDVYGGGSDGAMSLLLLGLISVNTEDVFLGIPYTYSITLHDGEYNIYNKYKIMPGGSLKVAEDATLTLATENTGDKEHIGMIIVYEDSFYENTTSIAKQLMYPVKPNGTVEGGHFVVNGTLIIDDGARFGGEITGETAGAKIEIYTANANLELSSREAIHLKNGTFTVTYEQTSSAYATGSGGKTELKSGYAYTYGSDGSWK